MGPLQAAGGPAVREEGGLHPPIFAAGPPSSASARAVLRPRSDVSARPRSYPRGVELPGFVLRTKRRWVANGLPDYPMWIAALIDSAALVTAIVVVAQRHADGTRRRSAPRPLAGSRAADHLGVLGLDHR